MKGKRPRRGKEGNGYREECDAGMGQRDEVLCELGEGPFEEIVVTVSWP